MGDESSKPGPAKRYEKNLTVPVSQEYFDVITELAHERHVSKSALVRQALQSWFRRLQEKDEEQIDLEFSEDD